VVHTLAGGEWIRQGRPLCLIGDSGTGKPYLLIGLGITAAENGVLDHFPCCADGPSPNL
jgi:DNA replication protein DnaC